LRLKVTMSEQVNPPIPRTIPELRARLRRYFHGKTPDAVRFRLGVIGLDVLLIAFFMVTPFIRDRPSFLIWDYLIAAIVAVDICARALASYDLKRWFFWTGLIDIAVLMTLLFPLWLASFAFLRILRLWSLVHSDFFWQTIGRRYDDTRWEDTTKAVVSLVTFLFLCSGAVYAFYARQHAQIDDFIDALYFTVTTITTTGYGDITLPGAPGKLLTILMMLAGVGLFVRLAHAVFRPAKVRFPCPTCGLQHHDPDAVHCKACGQTLNIPNEDG
jgi:voltage-gated potassium channel